MSEVSIYHIRQFGKSRTIRFNLAAVRRLLPEYEIENFNLTSAQRAKMQKRVNLYVKLGGKCDLGQGADAKPERFIPSKVVKERTERTVNGRTYPATKRKVIPARLEAAKPEMAPSLDHLPSHAILEKVFQQEGQKA